MGKKSTEKEAPKPVETDIRKLAVVLLAYAHRYAASVGWKTRNHVLAQGQGIEDLVQDALGSLYGGEPTRRWDQTKHPDPMDHLRSFVNSRLSSLARSYENHHTTNAIDPDRHAHVNTPESLLIAKRQIQERDAWFAGAKDLLQTEILGDDTLIGLHDLMDREELDKPAEVAARLGISVEAAKNAKKRFRRAWERVVAAMPRSCTVKKGDA